MPTTGQKDADGYVWNGGQWVSQDGYAKGSPEDKKSKRGWVSKAWDFGTDVAKDMASDLTKAETWADPTGGRSDSGLGWVRAFNDALNPTQSFGAAKVSYNKGDTWGALGNLAMGGVKAYTGGRILAGGLAATGIGTANPFKYPYATRFMNTGTKGLDEAANLIQGSTGLNRVAATFNAFSPSTLGKISAVAGPLVAGYTIYKSATAPPKPTASSVLPGPSYTMTAEEMAKRAAMESNRTDAAGNSGMGGRRIYADPMINTRAPGGTTPPPLDLAPLTPEQLNATGQDLVELEQVYQDALNQYGLAEKRGQQGYVQDVQGARRQAAGSAQDLASQLAASGMDISPAAAFGAGQMTNAPRMARETSARKTLDQLLAEITTGRTQARTQRDRNKLMTNNQINAYRNQNSFDAQQAAYERMAGN